MRETPDWVKLKKISQDLDNWIAPLDVGQEDEPGHGDGEGGDLPLPPEPQPGLRVAPVEVNHEYDGHRAGGQFNWVSTHILMEFSVEILVPRNVPIDFIDF